MNFSILINCGLKLFSVSFQTDKKANITESVKRHARYVGFVICEPHHHYRMMREKTYCENGEQMKKDQLAKKREQSLLAPFKILSYSSTAQ